MNCGGVKIAISLKGNQHEFRVTQLGNIDAHGSVRWIQTENRVLMGNLFKSSLQASATHEGATYAWVAPGTIQIRSITHRQRTDLYIQ